MKIIILIFSLFLSILPVFLIAYYFYKKDTIKEPKRLLTNLFIGGIISGIIVTVVSFFGMLLFPSITNIKNIDNYFDLIIYTYIFIALIEETGKFLIIYKKSYNSIEFDQAYDIILYSVLVGLGFATFENIIYILSKISIETVILRSITAVPAHVCFQTLMGYYLYLSKTKDKQKYIFLSLAIPFLLHGTYDFLIFTGSNIFTLGLLVSMFITAKSKVDKLIKIDNNNLKQYCPNCGTKINYNYCSNCGLKKQ